MTVALADEVVAGLLPAVLADEPDERVITDTLLDRVDLVNELERLVDGLAELLTHASAARTRRAYESDVAHFSAWVTTHRLAVMPAAPQTVALYLTAHQDQLRPSSLLRRLSAIAVAHRGGGHPSPTGHELVRRAVAALRRKHGTRPAAKAALVTAQLTVICTRLQEQETPTPTGPDIRARQADRLARRHAAVALRVKRDRALLLIGYAAALRRSELVGLNIGDLTEHPAGLSVFIARSKTDQEGLGDYLGITHGHPPDTCTATCPIRAWTEWRDALAQTLGIMAGNLPPDSPAFRPITRHGRPGTPSDPDPHARLTGQSVALIVKQAVELLGDQQRFPSSHYAGHSLRAGFATQAAAAGVPLDRIMRQTRHSSVAVALRYIRDADVWRDNPSGALGL